MECQWNFGRRCLGISINGVEGWVAADVDISDLGGGDFILCIAGGVVEAAGVGERPDKRGIAWGIGGGREMSRRHSV